MLAGRGENAAWGNNASKMAWESVIEKGTGGCGRLVLRASVNLL
jgi:hypothetical protein